MNYLSVSDVDRTQQVVESAGGSTLLAPGDQAMRGRTAIVAKANSKTLDLIQSTTDDPRDNRAEEGNWIWQ